MTLDPAVTERVLERLGFAEAPARDRTGLDATYLAWCRRVPFDNLVKRIHLAGGSPDPIPNGEPNAFFERWLRDGTGGTCWPSSGGLHALLAAVGFDARRGSAAMYDNLSGPIHTHGTVIARIDGADYWVDSSMLTERILPLVPGEEARFDDPVHGTRVEPVDDLWRIWWTHPFLDEMIGCLLLDDDVTTEHYLDRYEWSRGWSPFNASVYAVRDFGESRVAIAFGNRYERRAGGVTSAPPVDDRTRVTSRTSRTWVADPRWRNKSRCGGNHRLARTKRARAADGSRTTTRSAGPKPNAAESTSSTRSAHTITRSRPATDGHSSPAPANDPSFHPTTPGTRSIEGRREADVPQGRASSIARESDYSEG